MSNIQKLIKELKVEKSKPRGQRDIHYITIQGKNYYPWYSSKSFDLLIQKLTLLLNAETQATVKKPEA